MSAELATAAEPLADRLNRHLDLLLRIEEILREERTELQTMQREASETPPGESTGYEEVIIELRRQNHQLVQQVAEIDERLAGNLERSNEAARALEQEVNELRLALHEKDALVEELRSRSLLTKDNPEDVEEADYEAELNDFRRQLEADRQLLDSELQRVRARNAELKEEARAAELEMSRERAQLARERSQLERMRDEFRQEVDRAQRHAGVNEHLASVRRLKESMTERNRALDDPAPPADPGDRSSSRWRNFLPGSGKS
jgi:chromosome segregation ATPase